MFDGSGAEGQRRDVWIVGDRIVHVGAPSRRPVAARRTIDARGLVVTPGFIDPHAHGDPRRTPGFENFVAMGVTTICLGQDGSSPGRGGLEGWIRSVERGAIALNIAPFVGHGSVRRRAGVGLDRNPTEAQLARMEHLVAEAMAAGAFGLSTGLEYEPGRFADSVELARVARPVGEHGGVVMSHMRSEDDGAIDAALDELFAQCGSAGCAAHVSHLKVVHGRGAAAAERVLARMAAARASGLRVTADLYPYLASYTTIGIVFPTWAKSPNDYAAVVEARRAELAVYLRRRVTARNGPGATLFGSGRFRGRTLKEVAADLGKPFEEVLIDDVGPRGASAAYFVMQRAVMERLLVDPHVVISSDGSPTMRHPRGHGAFARVLCEFVCERGRLSLAAAVHKMTGRTAAIVGLSRRGLIRPGHAADVLVFDPAQVQDRATFVAPFEKAEGFATVIVNGELVRDGCEFTDRRPGRVLRRR